MAAVMLLTVAAVAGLGAWLAVRSAKARIESQVREVAQLVEESNFPLTTAVLRQMQALSGAELIAVDSAGRFEAASVNMSDVAALKDQAAASGRPEISWTNRVSVDGLEYFHVTAMRPSQSSEPAVRLHILYPVDEYRRAWQRAVYPSMGFAMLALPVVMLLSFVTGSRIASRVARLRKQVDRIARGDFEQFAPPPGDDEIRALAEAVNRMAAMLASYEEEVRRTERMRTLAHLGGGIAHQLRNSATGCAMAVDLHASECPLASGSEALAVAKRQLQHMEEYIQRFLQLGKRSETEASETIDLVERIEDLLPLVQPVARHAHVELRWTRCDCRPMMTGDPERIGQLVINLVVNAIEAAAQGVAQERRPGRVEIELSRPAPARIMFTVADSGGGPAEGVRDNLFEPFVSEKPDGVGLGLSVAKEIAEQHAGQISWQRDHDRTIFTVELPCHETTLEPNRVAIVSR